jgi:hypothetical protein
MTEQERLDEILRMTQAYKAQEAQRRIPMTQAAEMGPGGTDEYAYLDQQQPPVTPYEGQFRPRLSTEQGQGPYPPLRAPGMLDPRTATPVPAGYTYGDDQVTRDPNGVPAWEQKPSPQAITSDINSTVFPGGKLARSLVAGGAQLPGMQATPVLSKGIVPILKELAASYLATGERPEKADDRARAIRKLRDEADSE